MGLNWLLVFVPVAVGLEHLAPRAHVWIFAASALAIIPLAGRMGETTEQLAERTGEGVGGLLNATFGNAAELMIALAALRGGLHDVVKASLAGSIIGNILLVLGAAILADGLRFPEQRFNMTAARSQATMLTLATIAIGSSVQVALFLAPVLVLASLALGPAPLDLAFRPNLVLAVLLVVMTRAFFFVPEIAVSR